VIRLSAATCYHRGGATGSIDARVDTLVWGVKGGRKLAAPVIDIDHLRNGFDGGRWIFVNAELADDFYRRAETGPIVQALVERSMREVKSSWSVPCYRLYLPGEPIQLNVVWHSAEQQGVATTVRSACFPRQNLRSVRGRPSLRPVLKPSYCPPLLPRDYSLLRRNCWTLNRSEPCITPDSGSVTKLTCARDLRLTVNKDYFELDGHPLAVVGTTYMSGEASGCTSSIPMCTSGTGTRPDSRG